MLQLKVKRVGVRSLAVVCALMGVVLGLLYGLALDAYILHAVLGPFHDRGKSLDDLLEPVHLSTATLLPTLLLSPVIAPLLGLVIGFVGGIIVALAYNFAARLTGGLVVNPEMIVHVTREGKKHLVTYEEYIHQQNPTKFSD